MLRIHFLQKSDENFDPGFPLCRRTGDIRVNLTYTLCSLGNPTE